MLVEILSKIMSYILVIDLFCPCYMELPIGLMGRILKLVIKHNQSYSMYQKSYKTVDEFLYAKMISELVWYYTNKWLVGPWTAVK